MKLNEVTAGEVLKSMALNGQKEGVFTVLKLIALNALGAIVFAIIMFVSLKSSTRFEFVESVMLLSVFGLCFFPGIYYRKLIDIVINKNEFIEFWIFMLVMLSPLVLHDSSNIVRFLPYIAFFLLQIFISKKVFKNNEMSSEFAGGMILRSEFKSNFVTAEKFDSFKITFLRFVFGLIGYIRFWFTRLQITFGLAFVSKKTLFDDVEYNYLEKQSQGALTELEVEEVPQAGLVVAVQHWLPEYIATTHMFLLEDEDPKLTSAFACYEFPIEKIAFETLLFKTIDDLIFYSIVGLIFWKGAL